MNLLVDRGRGMVIGGSRRVVVGGVTNHPTDSTKDGEKEQQGLEIRVRVTESHVVVVVVVVVWYLHAS